MDSGFASVDALIGLTILAAGVALALQALSQAQRLTHRAEMMAEARLLITSETGGSQVRLTETLTPLADRAGLCERRRVVRSTGGREHALIQTLRCADAGSAS
ncbi:hypothetical protein Q0812_10720 [Brevundimonas sp. 2R-24]|uniref:Uncharacterized protein n=1 Tax=Peiella sedimenti TaxID=3061083 RepID=A0ABT8SN35_9CAUL|nr:hypothetical protein [Caulobacteraceae bacterium XZ-24]